MNRLDPHRDSKPKDPKSQQSPKHVPNVIPNEQQPMYPAGPSMRVYHYVSPQTGHQLTSTLPPDHPEMICLQEGGHITHTKFGILGELILLK